MAELYYLHGFMGDRSDLAPLFPDGIGLELPYHGENTATPQSWAEAIVAVAAQLPETPVHLVGYSMGGRVALAIAVNNLANIERLTVLAGNPGLKRVAERVMRGELDRRRADQLETDPDWFLGEWENLPLFGMKKSGAWKRYQNRTQYPTRWAQALRVLSLCKQPPYWDSLESLPLTFVAGQYDDKFRKLYTENGIEPLLVSGAWHAVHRDQPEAVMELLHG